MREAFGAANLQLVGAVIRAKKGSIGERMLGRTCSEQKHSSDRKSVV